DSSRRISRKRFRWISASTVIGEVFKRFPDQISVVFGVASIIFTGRKITVPAILRFECFCGVCGLRFLQV
ncbi:unnamed protein product, partial [Onchocerca flexuosa]|uniref:Glycosyltransferase n=1 Tax=Onchocerca flexuosa TaxID=387005 RepID=A0A183I7T1_9BILA